MSSSVDSASPPLLPAVAQGDTGAFAELYDRHSSVLYALLLRILASPGDAQEALQETFVEAWSNAFSFDPGRGSEIAWLIAIARRCGIDRLRSRGLRSDREHDAGREIPVRTSSVDNSAADAAIASRQRIAVRTALDALPPGQRAVLEFAYFEGLSHSEIAERTGEPLGTVKTGVQLGMKKLRDRLHSFR